LPKGLVIEIHSEDGFGTFFFDEVHVSGVPDGVTVAFRCHTPNKYWEGQFGLATFIAAIRDQAVHHDNWKVAQIEMDDDWKGITLERLVALGDPMEGSIRAAATDLTLVLHSAEVALSGLPWSEEYAAKEDPFCRELIQPFFDAWDFFLYGTRTASENTARISPSRN